MPKYDVNNKSVEMLLAWIKEGEIAIPEIQRPFVWDSTKVRDLIDSLYNGYPVGYIIVWKNPDVKLKDGTIATGKKVLIDGQQRITALTTAIIGMEVIDSNYKKKTITIAFNPLSEKFEVKNPAIEKNSEWIADISTVFKPDFSAFSFIMNYCMENNIVDNMARDTLNNTIQKLQNIRINSIGVIELSSAIDIDEVTEIFIRINSKGVVLSQADFAMSKISANEKYNGDIIRKTIDYFCHLACNKEDFNNISNNDNEFCNTDNFNSIKWVKDLKEDLYVPDYNDLLRVSFTSKFKRGRLSDLVSLLSGRDFETREYRDDIAENSFEKLHKGVLSFVNKTNFERFLMIVKSTGIIDKSLIRSKNVLNFAYILYLTLRDRGIKSNIIENVVRRWIVLSILTQRYSSSPESAFDYDIKRFDNADDVEALVRNVEEGELSDAFWDNILVTKLNTSVASSPYFNVFLMSQITSNDKGFLSKSINVSSLIEQRGDIHHLFPKKYLQNNGLNSRTVYNQIANYVYMQSEINIQIKDKAPSIYFNEIKEQCILAVNKYGSIDNLEDLNKNLEMNCVPKEIFNMDVEYYSEFLEKRRLLMAKKIKKYYFKL